MRKFLSAIILILILLTLNSSLLAGRAYLPFTPDADIFAPNQNALIAWNGKEEILILSAKLSASKNTKVLEIIPLPSEPEVKKSNLKLLDQANEFLTARVFDDLRKPVLRNEINKKEAAEVKQEIIIGPHNISIIKVSDQKGFIDRVNNYLQKKGKDSPQISAELSENINDYINKGYEYFIFDTIEVSSEAKFNQPISYTFKTDKLYYPLQIAKSTLGHSEIVLFILTDQNLINYRGIAKDKIKNTASTKINYDQTASISNEIADLFVTDSAVTENSADKLRLLKWKIKDKLSNFNDDLLVDNNLAPLLKNKYSKAGTTYLDFKKDEDYPYQTNKKIEKISGKIEIAMGSRMYPWIAPAVKGKVLFSAKTENLIQNFAEEGKSVILKGYSSQGNIIMRNPFDSMPSVVAIGNSFFVTEIIGWTPYSGIALNEDGLLNSKRTRFWLKNK